MRFVIALLALIAAPLAAQNAMPAAPYAYTQLDDPALEAQATELMESLRCLTCQSQNINDSDAPMASDMRHHVRARLLAGESPEQIRSWLITRYGDYVSYQPEMSATTWPLFAIPLVLVALVGLALLGRLRRRADAGNASDKGDAA